MLHLSDSRTAPFYVFGGFAEKPVRPWVLGLYATRKDAERAVAWQGVGQGDERDFRVCTFNPARQMFEPITGGAVDFPLSRGIYTREAYGAFMAAHGVDPRRMMDPKTT